jgi:hypothetical protein
MKNQRRFVVFGLILLVLMQSTVAGAGSNAGIGAIFSSQEGGLGVERQLSLSTNPATDNFKPASAYNSSNHQTLIVWHRHSSTSYWIEGRLLDAAGKPLGSSPTIFVSGSTPVYQPVVAYNATYNEYLVTWMRNTLLDGKTYAIWAKILSASLTEVRPEYEIEAPGTGASLWSPRTAWNSVHNEYMIAWNVFDISAWPGMVPTAIAQASLYENGDIIPNPITVIYNEPPDKMIYPQQVDIVFYPSGDPFGKYMWVWKQVKPGTADYDIWAAQIDAYLGGITPGLPPWKVDDSTYDQSNPHIASSNAGDFMIVWQERSPVASHDWDIRGREMNQIGTLIGDLHIIAGFGSTDETDPFIAAWPGATPRYVVGYTRASATGTGVWLAYNNDDANVLHASGYAFWMDYFAAADYGFWYNQTATGVTAGPRVQVAYQGVSNVPGDNPQIYSRAWTPFLSYLPVVTRQ